MAQVNFYHLTRAPLHEAASALLERAVKQGWRVMLRGAADAQGRAALERLDEQLRLYPEESFLPHGIEGGAADAAQPVLLGQGPVVNGANALMLLAGAPVVAAEAQEMERVWLLFEGGDEAQVMAARAEWRAVVGAGHVAQYWSDESGRWEMKTASGGAG